jgi:P27 family predicted phage terminase small subunit
MLGPDGKELWSCTLRAIQNSNLLQEQDYPMLVGYCQAYEIMQMAWRHLNSQPGDERILDETLVGFKTSDAFKVWRQAKSDMEATAKQLGFSPLARAQLNITNAAATSIGLNVREKFLELAAQEEKSQRKSIQPKRTKK